MTGVAFTIVASAIVAGGYLIDSFYHLFKK